VTKALTLTPIVDPEPALAGMREIGSGTTRLSGQMGTMGGKSKGAFGMMAGGLMASGLPGQFGEVGMLVQGLGGQFTGMGNKGKKSWGTAMMGAGAVITGLGVIGMKLGAPLEDATAKLDKSIKNTGGSVSALDGPIGKARARMQGLGYTYADTENALTSLTIGLGSPKKALAELSTVSDVAAKSGGTLEAAAGSVVKAYAGSTRILKQYGINVTAITKSGTLAVSDQKKAAAASAKVQKDQLALSNLTARQGASTGTKGVAANNALATAQNELSTASAKLQTEQLKLQDGTGNQSTAMTTLAADQARVTAATTKLQTEQNKALTTGTLTVTQQQQLSAANAKLAADTALAGTATANAAATHKDLGKAVLTGGQVMDMVKKKVNGLALAQSKTFGGDIRKWKATITDFGATWGAKFAKPLVAIGPTLMGVGAMLQYGFFGKIGSGIKSVITGIGPLASKLGSLVGIGSKTGTEAGAPGGMTLKPDEPGAATPPGGPGTTTGSTATSAAETLQTAAEALQGAAETLQTAATEMGGAATETGAAATGLDGAGTSLDVAGTGLDAAGTGLDAAGTAIDASSTALDASSAALDTSAAAGGVAGAAKGVGGVGAAGGVLAAGVVGYGIGTELDKHTVIGKEAQSAGNAVANFFGVGDKAAMAADKKAGAKALSLGAKEYLEKIARGTLTDKTGFMTKKGAISELQAAGIHNYAQGGVVPAVPGGTLVRVAEAGQAEQIGPVGGGHAPAAAAPQVVHYHQVLHIDKPTIVTPNLAALQAQLEAEAKRANFSGAGLPGGGD
jgi:hypothetical protein